MVSNAAIPAIDLTAEKTLVRADGRSTTILTARIFDDRGAPIADGTRVQFSTTLGRLDTLVAESRNGVARVTLTASDQPGTATITANLEGTSGAIPAHLQVIFTNDVPLTESSDRWMRIENASYIGYAFAIPNNPGRFIYAEDKANHATLSYRDLTITSQRLILDTGKRSLKAEGDVVVRIGKVERHYKQFRYDFASKIGYGERVEEFRLISLEVKGQELKETPLRDRFARQEWNFPDLSEAQITVVARSIMLDFDSSLQFRNATFYIQGQKAFSTKFHIMSPQQLSLYREQLVGLGSNGLWLNFPYYYGVSPRGVGTLHLRRGGQFGSSVYSQRSGWTLDLDQTYNSRNGLEGLFQVLNLARADRGYRLQHNQSLGKGTDASLFADLIGGKDLFASTQIGHSFPQFRLAVSAAGSRYHGIAETGSETNLPANGAWRIQTLAETFPRVIAPKAGVRYALTASHTDQHFFGQSTPRGPLRTDNLGTRLFSNPVHLDRETTLTQSGVVGYTWIAAPAGTVGVGTSGTSLQTTTAFSRPIRWHKESLGNLQLAYDYFQTPPLFIATTPTTGTNGQPSFTRQGRQRVGLTTYLASEARWGFSFSGSRGIDTPQSTVYSETRVSLGGPWLGRVRLTETQSSGYGYRDWEYALIRTVNNREVALYYSTIAGRFQLDLTGFSF